MLQQTYTMCNCECFELNFIIENKANWEGPTMGTGQPLKDEQLCICYLKVWIHPVTTFHQHDSTQRFEKTHYIQWLAGGCLRVTQSHSFSWTLGSSALWLWDWQESVIQVSSKVGPKRFELRKTKNGFKGSKGLKKTKQKPNCLVVVSPVC